jgi:diguanylate cyclase (GGDEF)-like protein
MLAPAGHPLLLWPAVAAVCGLLLSQLVWLPLSAGFATIIQPWFVLLVFVVPLNTVPAIVAAGGLFGTIIHQRSLAPARLLVALGDCWYCLPPVVILALFAPGPAQVSKWPVYALAFGAEFAADIAIPYLVPPPSNVARQPRPIVLLPAVLDALLTPIGIAAAIAAPHAPGGAVFLVACTTALMALLGREHQSRVEQEHRAARDPLTGLVNRGRFDNLLDATWLRCTRSGTTAAVLSIDLDGFKAINDEFGHLIGDHVLREIAERLLGAVDDADTVARVGGDEFAILLSDATGKADAHVAAENVAEALRAPLPLPDYGELLVTGSIGTATIGRHATPLEALIDSDRDMYAAKRDTRGTRRGGVRDPAAR